MKWLPLLLLAFASPAKADITAVYETAREGGFQMTMTIELADNGDLRGTVTAASWDGKPLPAELMPRTMTLNGEGYYISPTPTGVIVNRVSDLAAVIGELAKHEFPEAMTGQFAEEPPMEFEARGTRTIHGRIGTAWYVRRVEPRGEDVEPEAVISPDPVLAPLGAAMARQFEMSAKGLRQMTGRPIQMGDQLNKLLASGGPLSFAGMELVSVDTKPIPADHFLLPATPETREALRARMAADMAAAKAREVSPEGGTLPPAAPAPRSAPETPAAPPSTPAPAAPRPN